MRDNIVSCSYRVNCNCSNPIFSRYIIFKFGNRNWQENRREVLSFCALMKQVARVRIPVMTCEQSA